MLNGVVVVGKDEYWNDGAYTKDGDYNGWESNSVELTEDNLVMVKGNKVFEDNGVRVVVDKKSFLYLVGTTLEYSGGLNGTGFVFNNPNANRTCGCGESFSL